MGILGVLILGSVINIKITAATLFPAKEERVGERSNAGVS
jgi:hypothetical protein